MNFTQEQRYEIIEKIIKEGKGIEEILKISLEILMKAEREGHNLTSKDMSNGYRYRKPYGRGRMLELKVPRTRNGNFYPVILGLLRDQEEEAKQIAFKLYGAGLTTEQVGELFGEIYGERYSKSQVSRMFEYAREEVFSWDDKNDTKAAGMERWKEFCKKWKEYYPVFGNKMNNERNVYYFTYLDYHYKIRSMIYTTNWIERLNRDYKRTTKMRGALPNPESTILLLGHVAMTRKSYEYKIPLFKMEDKKFRWEE